MSGLISRNILLCVIPTVIVLVSTYWFWRKKKIKSASSPSPLKIKDNPIHMNEKLGKNQSEPRNNCVGENTFSCLKSSELSCDSSMLNNHDVVDYVCTNKPVMMPNDYHEEDLISESLKSGIQANSVTSNSTYISNHVDGDVLNDEGIVQIGSEKNKSADLYNGVSQIDSSLLQNSVTEDIVKKNHFSTLGHESESTDDLCNESCDKDNILYDHQRTEQVIDGQDEELNVPESKPEKFELSVSYHNSNSSESEGDQSRLKVIGGENCVELVSSCREVLECAMDASNQNALDALICDNLYTKGWSENVHHLSTDFSKLTLSNTKHDMESHEVHTEPKPNANDVVVQDGPNSDSQSILVEIHLPENNDVTSKDPVNSDSGISDEKATMQNGSTENASIPTPEKSQVAENSLSESGIAMSESSKESTSLSSECEAEFADECKNSETTDSLLHVNSHENGSSIQSGKLSPIDADDEGSDDSTSVCTSSLNTKRSSLSSIVKANDYQLDALNQNKGDNSILMELKVPPCSSTHYVYEFELPQELCGRLIGKQGKHVKSIKERSNANVFIKRHPYDAQLKIVVVEGNQADVNNALDIIRRKYPPSQFPSVTLMQTNALSSSTVMVPESMQLHLPDGTTCDVILSSLISAGHFFLQQPTHPTYSFMSAFDQSMTQCYSQMDTPLLPHPVEAGVICAAPIMQGWYRAQVIQLQENGTDCQVKFVDYGGFSQMPSASLRQIRSDFMTFPFQATECYLANVRPIDSELGWTPEASAVFEELAQGQILQAIVAGYADDGLECVNLYRVQGISNLFINKELVDRGYAVWVDRNLWDPH